MNNEIAIIKFAGGIKLSENHFKGEKKIRKGIQFDSFKLKLIIF